MISFVAREYQTRLARPVRHASQPGKADVLKRASVTRGLFGEGLLALAAVGCGSAPRRYFVSFVLIRIPWRIEREAA
jgi:hypothetical protein